MSFENGECSLCRQSGRSSATCGQTMGQDKLLERLTSKKNTGYDCIIPLSGGKDSSYIVYYVTRELGKKPLAVFFDSGFITELAKKNIEKICKSLGVDLVAGKATGYRRKLIRESLRISTLVPKTALKGQVCANCENNLRTFAINEATKRRIPYIIWGSTDFEDSAENLSTESTFRGDYGSDDISGSINKKIRKLSGLLRAGFPKYKLSLLGLYYSRYYYYTIRDNIAMKAPGGWRKLNPFLEVSFDGKNAEVLYFFDYIQYDPNQHVEVLKKELDWEAPESGEMRIDCRLHAFSNYWDLKNTGITSDGFILATLARNGLISREDALIKEKVLSRKVENQYSELMKEFGKNVGMT